MTQRKWSGEEMAEEKAKKEEKKNADEEVRKKSLRRRRCAVLIFNWQECLLSSVATPGLLEVWWLPG